MPIETDGVYNSREVICFIIEYVITKKYMKELLVDLIEFWEQDRKYYGNDYEVFVNDFTNNRIDCYDEINDFFKENISDWNKWHEHCRKQVIETTIKILKK